MGSDPEILRKILVMTFDDSYLRDAGEIITKKKIRAIKDTGYINFENKDKNIIYTFLSNQILRTWYHHFTGTYGVIIINEGINFNDNINEISNLLNSKILIKRPFLIVYDKKKILEKDNKHLEYIRYLLAIKQVIYNVIYIDFKIEHSTNELLYGLDWLNKQIMKII